MNCTLRIKLINRHKSNRAIRHTFVYRMPFFCVCGVHAQFCCYSKADNYYFNFCSVPVRTRWCTVETYRNILDLIQMNAELQNQPILAHCSLFRSNQPNDSKKIIIPGSYCIKLYKRQKAFPGSQLAFHRNIPCRYASRCTSH